SYVYNNDADIDALLEGIQQVQEFWSA
ncbi:MAG: hypothetical protein QOG99_398, partial [Frankiales bacterium]|nr:hypothetical protein [Frankiales bacterium]